MRLRPLLLIAPLFAMACSGASSSSSSDEAQVQASPDISRTDFVESGRLAPDAALSADATLDGKVRAYRFNAFGQTKVKITVTSSDFTPAFTIDGPIPGSEKKVVAYENGRSGTATLETTLAEPGAYRILVGSRAMLAGGKASGGAHVDFACEENCDLPEISLSEALRDLAGKVGQEGLSSALGQWVQANVSDPDLQKQIGDHLSQVTLAAIPDDLVAPIIPMSLLRVGQGIFEQDKKTPAPAPQTQTFDLQKVLGDCTVTRGSQKPVNALLPGLMSGDFADYTYDDCSLARANAFASVLNNLAMENGSAVVDGDKKYTTIEDVVRALVASGHKVKIDNSRYYADFLGLAYNGKSVAAPVWIDTQIPMPDGGSLKIPAPHAHHNIYVSGPLLNAHFKFYMGVGDGTAFRVQANIMRHWSGGHAVYTYDSDADVEKIVKLLSLGGQLRKKWITAGANEPGMGYGILGVCTDSTAILEYALQGSVTLFPLAHPKADAAADDIDGILAKLPTDVEGFDNADAVRRIKSTLAFDSVDAIPFKPFVQELQQL